ncbi:MAG TPA: phage tail protein, partial [Gemmatimonadaceae bacterium]|nr:phage tail protein [Gemmatimonadaceae bacterium]
MTCTDSIDTTPDKRLSLQTIAPDFYSLLPEFMRVADAQRGSPLQALLAAAQAQANLVDADITALWQNFFVETCEDWVLPYIADLIDLTLIDDLAPNNRREVARTIAYRRRKGTVPQLETMANDITGWGVRVAEFFHNLHWTQHMIHFRPRDAWTIDVRNPRVLARLGSGFDRATYTADFRPATETQGRYNIRNLGFFCYRLQPIPLDVIPAAAAPAPAPNGAFHFDVLGQPEPLFVRPAPIERDADAPWPRVTEDQVVRPVPPYRFRESPEIFWQQDGGFDVCDAAGDSLLLTVTPADLCDWSAIVDVGEVAVDVRLGRFLMNPADFPDGGAAAVTTRCVRGLSAPIGGGSYDRQASLSPPASDV